MFTAEASVFLRFSEIERRKFYRSVAQKVQLQGADRRARLEPAEIDSRSAPPAGTIPAQLMLTGFLLRGDQNGDHTSGDVVDREFNARAPGQGVADQGS